MRDLRIGILLPSCESEGFEMEIAISIRRYCRLQHSFQHCMGACQAGDELVLREFKRCKRRDERGEKRNLCARPRDEKEERRTNRLTWVGKWVVMEERLGHGSGSWNVARTAQRGITQ